MYIEQNNPEAFFLSKLFAEYYSKHLIESIPRVENREFGFGVFKRKIANRNLSFSNNAELNSFLREKAPMFFSYSNSYYRFPARTPTIAKEWLAADIIYEFDADELGLEVPVINGVQWFSKEHLDEAKKQVFHLLDFLESDFDFPQSDALINFSGKAGYHIHLRANYIQNLNKQARIELVDYLTGNNLDFEQLGFDFEAHYAPLTKKRVGSWALRLVSWAKLVLSSDPRFIARITGVQQKKFVELLANKDKLFSSIDNGVLPRLDGKKSSDFWRSIFGEALKRSRCPIDRQTSIDLNKIIRVPETLHGDTGFVAKAIPLDELNKFDAFNDAIVFGDDFSRETIRVHVLKAPKFFLHGESFGPFEESIEELPLFCAVYLIGKGVATLKK